MAPASLTICVVTYRREDLLCRFLDSLSIQDDLDQVELVLIDNGNPEGVGLRATELLEEIKCPQTLLTYPENLLSPLRVEDILSKVRTEWVVLPGDDDLLLQGFAREALKLIATAGDDVTLLSMGARMVGLDTGEVLGTYVPPSFSSQQAALASLLSANPYWLPVTLFRPRQIPWVDAPRVMSAFDWWIWIQTWLQGVSLQGPEVVLDYSEHDGQEKREYGVRHTRLEAARMIAGVAASQHFRRVLAEWDSDQVREFTDHLLEGPGPNFGDPLSGPLLQCLIGDALLASGHDDQGARLMSQAYGAYGIVPTAGAASMLSNQPGAQVPLPLVWSRLDIGAMTPTCDHETEWISALGMSVDLSRMVVVAVECSCKAAPTKQLTAVSLSVGGRRQTLSVSREPDETSLISVASWISDRAWLHPRPIEAGRLEALSGRLIGSMRRLERRAARSLRGLGIDRTRSRPL